MLVPPTRSPSKCSGDRSLRSGGSKKSIALPTELKRRSGFLVCQQFARLVETFGADHDGQERPGGYVLRLIWIQAKRMSAMMSEPIA